MQLRVCAYCRVSTDKDDQLNSLQNQKDFFESYIRNHENWELVHIWVDEGISGTSTKKRVSFNQMIEECKKRNVDLVLTKEVSRFARNTVDTLEYTRLLKRYQVGVLFINDNIDTRENDGEFRLSIMASVAQEESRKTSERVKWGQKRSMEKGRVFGNDTTFGFITKNGTLSINVEEAKTVQLIYHKFLNEGKGTHVIARELYEAGINPPKTTSGKWSNIMILRILRNEKHCGDLIQKKHITTDYLTHKKIPNNGIEDKIRINNHHEAIIDREMWEQTQAELKKRSSALQEKLKYSNRYWCSGKIICGNCGSRFVQRKNKNYSTWSCHNKAHYGKWKRNHQGDEVGCNMHMLNNKVLLTCVRHVLEQLDTNTEEITKELIAALSASTGFDSRENAIGKMKQQLNEIAKKKAKLLDAYFSERITDDDLSLMKEKYEKERLHIVTSIEQTERQTKIMEHQKQQLSELSPLIKNTVLDSEDVYGETIEKITVYDDCITAKPFFLPFQFKLTYSTSGYNENYTTRITSCEMEAIG